MDDIDLVLPLFCVFQFKSVSDVYLLFFALVRGICVCESFETIEIDTESGWAYVLAIMYHNFFYDETSVMSVIGEWTIVYIIEWGAVQRFYAMQCAQIAAFKLQISHLSTVISISF